jgi:D-galactarolactone cycloisomerase
MKITKVESIVLDTPMIIEGGAVPMPGGIPRTSFQTLLVRIDTDAGVTGWGEGHGARVVPTTRTAVDTLVAPMCIGRDPTAINALTEDLERKLSTMGRSGPAMYALSAIDIALWDIAGKLAGLPLYRLLGGATRETVPAYASLLRYVDPAIVSRFVERALKRGYRQIKLHEITYAPVKAARDTAGPGIPIMVDCNCAWPVEQAVGMARQLKPLQLKWLEEPVWPPEDYTGLARVRTQGGIPTAAGENAMFPDFKWMFEAGAVAFAQPSINKIGGVTQLRKTAALAEAFGVKVMPHAACLGPGLLATIHCIAAMPGETHVERYDVDVAANPLHDAIHPNSDGTLNVPQGPGLGIEPDAAVIEKFRVA